MSAGRPSVLLLVVNLEAQFDRVDHVIFDLTTGVYFNFYKIRET